MFSERVSSAHQGRVYQKYSKTADPSFRNHSNMMIWCSKNIHYYQCCEQLCCFRFL